MRLPSRFASLALSLALLSVTAAAQAIEGTVTTAGHPLAAARVVLWRTDTRGAPTALDEGTTDAAGRFRLDAPIAHTDGEILYLTSSGPVGGVVLLSVLGGNPPEQAVVNELTTVASAFTHARFIASGAIAGDALGLHIAAGNLRNLVDPVTGTWGRVLLDPVNSTQNTTLARLNTLGALLCAFATVADDAWRADFLQAATPAGGAKPDNTLDAAAGIGRAPWAHAAALYDLFDKAYPRGADGGRRGAPFLPYLDYVPADFALILKFAGGGIYSAGRLGIDSNGNVWSGQSWMAGSQSSPMRNIGGGTIKLAPDGTALSPPITGFTPMGVDGIGWGTGVSADRVWLAGMDGRLGLMDLAGRPLDEAATPPFATGELGGLMGVGVAANGDVWIADGTRNNLLHFPGGRVADGRIVEIDGLRSPFGIAVDNENRVWVGNSGSDTLVRFPADDPSKAETFRAGVSVRGVALDSKGNLWAASNMSPDFPPPAIPDGASMMEQIQILLNHVKDRLSPENPTGVVDMIRPDGTRAAPMGFTGDKAISVPWGLSIDGNDDVWVGNFWGRGVVLMAGDHTQGHGDGTRTGDVIHVFQSGSIQMVSDVAIDPAGTVWIANNLNDIAAMSTADPPRAISTQGGGDGIVAIYGVAAPVKTPLMGQVRRP